MYYLPIKEEQILQARMVNGLFKFKAAFPKKDPQIKIQAFENIKECILFTVTCCSHLQLPSWNYLVDGSRK
jgi:hypothetical protein